MKRRRRCRHCHDLFLPDPRSYRPTADASRRVSAQHFCGKPECRRQSRNQTRKRCLRRNPRYRRRCLESARRWRKRHAGYSTQYRTEHPEKAAANRRKQKRRDKRRRDLANNSTIESIRCEKLRQIETAIDLANNSTIGADWVPALEGIHRYLRWTSRLANNSVIDRREGFQRQSPA